MDDATVERTLADAEASLDQGGSLKGTGFWKAIGAVKRDPALVSRFADRIAVVDRRAFEAGVRLRVPAVVGLVGLFVLSVAGVVILVVAGGYEGVVHVVLFGAATGALLVGTHSLSHWLVGKAVGMRFTHVFLGGPPPPRPGVKTDYATYLRATPRARAVMHASGAVVTKLVPFVLIPVALAQDAWPGLVWILLGLGVLQIVTDVAFSTKSSDWMKVRRELRAGGRLTGSG